jgi:hypothetical protein
MPRLTDPLFAFLGRGWTENSRPALVICAGSISGEWGGLYARSVEFPDFSARYDAPGSIAGHRRGIGVRTFRLYLATQCTVLETKADSEARPGLPR